ncbi:unnamed protein product, partial [Adineta steineri]
MNHFCTTPFWNENITNSSYPYVTECFRNTVLQWVPMGIFWLILPLWLYALVKQQMKSQVIQVSTLFITKMILTTLFILIQIIRIIHYVFLSMNKEGHANWFTPVLYIITAMTIIWLINYERLKSVFASGLLFIFWLLVSLASIPDIIHYSVTISLWIVFISVWLHFLFAFGLFITNCFAEKYIISDVVPELYVSFPSRIFFGWVTPLILRGYKKPLTEKDCWQLSKSEQTVTVVHQVQNFMKDTKISYDDKLSNDENRNLLTNLPIVDIKKSSSKQKKSAIFWHALFRTYRDKLIAGGLIRLAHDLTQLSGPIILKLVLNYFADSTKPIWLGIFYAILLSTCIFCQIVLLRSYFQCQFLVGLRFRSAITGLIYRKSLKLSNSSKQETTTGEIVNLMAIDASRFGEITTQMHILWSGPLLIIITLVLLYRQMQWSIIPGVVVLFIMIPINLFLQRMQKKLTYKQMIVKDQRIKTMSEILNGIKVIKLYAWEMAFIHSITRIRDKELGYIRQKAIVTAISNILWTFTPILVGIATFAAYILSSNENILTADKAFVSLALFHLLRGPLNQFPNVITSVIDARVSNKRIQKFLNNEELDENAVNKISTDSKLLDGNSIKIENGSFRWSNVVDDPLILKNINLEIQQGSLIALVGMVGSGKSSILAALLGEMNKVHGNVSISGKIAYVPQTAWIMNVTLRENILFGQDFDENLYNRVIEACALKQDLDMLPAGDQTEIGEKGINLSGGQRQRVSLARALYSNADIYLLDDPLSAVDAHVGAHIFKKVIGPKGLLNTKTRLLVTHGVSHLNKCNNIIVVSHGEIVDYGLYNDLMIRSKILQDFVHSVVTSDTEQYSRQTSTTESLASIHTTSTELIHNPSENDIQHDGSTVTTIAIEEEMKKIIQKETIQTGSVKLNIFSIYIHACKLTMVMLITLFFCLTACASLSANIWLSQWTDKAKENNNTSSNNRIRDMNIYSTLGLIQGLFAFAMQLTLKLATYIAGRKLHWIILIGVLHAPMSFFDTTPIGRVINRFARDIDAVDSTLPAAFSQSFTTLITVVTTLILLIYGSWFAIIALIPLSILFGFIQRVYVSSSRQLGRLDSVTRSSIYANFAETIQGLSSIRAYHAQQRFIDVSDRFVDRNISCHFASSVANRWLGVRLEMIGNTLVFFTAIIAVFMPDRMTAGTVGLMITFAMQITNSLNMLVRMSSDIETNTVSVERINEYAELTPEASWEIPETKPSSHWPKNGNIQIKNLSTQYRQNLPLVLKDLTIDIQPGEKIGIIGRTGSGKSSLCLALFRIIEPINGTIVIDNVDIRHIEPLSNQESPATVDSTIKSNSATNLLDPQATVDVSDDSPATSSRIILSPIKGAVLFAIFTCIVMLIGILIVYFNSPKPPGKLCTITLKSEAQNSISDDSHPQSIAIGDFNNDIRPDIVVSNSNTNTIGVFLRNDSHSFKDQQTYSTGYGSLPYAVSVGDFNNDQRLDIAVANFGTNNIGIFLGIGNGQFRSQKIFTTESSRPRWIAVGDINNDTQLDLVVVNYGTNDVGILLGDGYGNFGKPVVFSTGFDSMPYFLAIADLDNDGYLDIAVANHGTRNIGLFFGRGNGTLTNQIIFNIGISSYPYSIAADDLNNDTYKDIVVACSGYTNSIHVLLGFGNRTYANSNNYLIGNSTSSAVSVVIGDFNNDDIYDIAVNNYAHDSISVFFGSGDGIFLDEATIYSSYGSKPYAIIAGDFNNDTRLDLAAVNYDYNYIDIILVYRNYSFLSQTIYPTSDIDTQPNSIVFADMNNDHQLDIVVTNFWSDNIGIYLNEGNNTFSNQTTYSTNSDSGPSSVITGDFNNDDQLDILVTNQNLRAIGIFLGNSSGIFSNQTTYSINAQPVSVATGDFNDDNRPDVVIVDSTSNIIGVLLALEDGTFSSQTTYSTGKDSLPSAITIGDFNNDKQLDIVVANYLGRNIGIFFGYGNGSFSSQQTYSTGQDSSPISVVASDVNGDKVLDIIVANYDMNNIGILFGYSNISFSLQYSYSTGNNSNPYCIIVDDVNNDTNPDIIVANYQIGNIGIFLGNQDGTFSIQTTYSTGITSNPKSITIGDVNNDGWADIAVANYGAANIGILSGYGNGSFTDQKTLSSKSGTTPFSLAMGDFNNDNQLDIIVANYQGNNVDIFFGYSDGSFGDRRSYSTGSDSKPFAVATADFNNDNQLDFVVANRESNSISIFFGYANVTFSLQGTYSTGSDSEPYTIAIGDLNNDKRLDVVVANAKADNIGIFLNYDNGSFSAQQTYSTGDGSFPIDVAIDDFNNDNILDIAVANRETSTLGIFLGQNNTSFSNQTSYSIGIATSPGGLAISDLDNDGYLDIVITATYASCINIFLGYGNGKFFPSDKYLTGGGSRPGSCTIADWNHDNVQDVIVTNCVTNTIGVLVGFGDGTFSNAITYSTGSNSCPNSIVAGDFNNDSLLDVVVANSGAANIGVFLGSTYMDGVRENTYFTGSSPHPEVVGVGHFNNDTYLDIAISNYGLGTVGILLGSINGTFPLQTMFSTGTLSYPTSIVISDLDDDSQLDIAVTSSGGESVGILFSNGNGNFQDLNIYPTGLGSIPSSITIGDFNNDKKLDLVIANSGTNTVQTLLKYNIEAFRTQKRYSTSSQSAPQVVLVGDFNNDSRWDFVAVNTGLNNIGVFLGLENNTFSNQKTYTTGEKSSPYAAVVADVNNDNYLDIIVTNYWNDNVGVFLGFGDGNFADQVTYPTGSGSRPINLIIADFNHDTHLDIVVALHYIDKI